VLARAVVEATAKEKKIAGANLAAKIDEMRTTGLIREDVKEAAHEVRHFGNGMAHGDFIDPVSPDEAEEALVLMSEVLDEMFQAPARVDRVRQARLARKNGTANSTP
jgi:hypothetical protein